MPTVEVATVPVTYQAAYGLLEVVETATGTARGNLPSTITLDRSPFTVGRYRDLECHLDSPCISGRHCVFTRQESPGEQGGFRVIMADTSTNACYVNGVKVGRGRSVLLTSGDVIAFVIAAKAEHAPYNITLRFRALTPPAATPDSSVATAGAVVVRGPAAIAAAAKMAGANDLIMPVGGAAAGVEATPRPQETAPQRESQLIRAAAEVNQSDIESDVDAPPTSDYGSAGFAPTDFGLGGDSRPVARVASTKHRHIDTAYDLDLDNPLGSGSFATVYRGVHRRTGKIVAVKQINKKRFLLQQDGGEQEIPSSDPAVVAAAKKKHEKDVTRHRREIEILLAVKHAHVVRCYGVYETEDRLWFVLGYAAGGELFQMLKSFGSVPESLAKRIVSQLVAAVQYLHSVGIVHRDIKLENLLLFKPIGEMPTDSHSTEYHDWLDSVHVQVSDFGLSRTVGADRHLMSTMCGTPVYVAPEVTDVSLRIDGRTKGYTPAVDLFSVGVVAYALLTGRPPYPYAKDPRTGQRVKNRVDYGAKIQWPSNGPYGAATAEARHCVEGLLKVDPRARLSTGACLVHPWLLGLGTLAASTGGAAAAVLGGKRGREFVAEDRAPARDDDATP